MVAIVKGCLRKIPLALMTLASYTCGMGTEDSLELFARLFRAVYPAELARRAGVRPQAVFSWRAKGRVPAGRVLAVESATGIPRHEIRPDIYPPPDAAG